MGKKHFVTLRVEQPRTQNHPFFHPHSPPKYCPLLALTLGPSFRRRFWFILRRGYIHEEKMYPRHQEEQNEGRAGVPRLPELCSLLFIQWRRGPEKLVIPAVIIIVSTCWLQSERVPSGVGGHKLAYLLDILTSIWVFLGN